MDIFNKFREQRKSKNEDESSPTFDKIKAMIDAENTIRTFGRLTDDGEIEGTDKSEKENLKKVVDQLATDCMDYNNYITDARQLIRRSVLAGAAFITGAGKLTTRDPVDGAIAIGALFTGLVGAIATVTHADHMEDGKARGPVADVLHIFRQANQMESKIKKALLALRLPKDFVDQNFGAIVKAFVMKKREDIAADELLQTRREMKLDTSHEEDRQSLSDLLLDDKPKNEQRS